MRNVAKEVSKMDVQIGKMHRELAKLYEERARLMQKKMVGIVTASELDFPDEVIEELVNEKPAKAAKKAK
jgi:hypothetical protein